MSEGENQRERFGLGWPAVAMMMAFIFAPLLLVNWSKAESGEIGALLGSRIWGGPLICGVVGWLAFVTCGRSRRAATRIVTLTLLLGTVISLARGATSEATAKRIVAGVLHDLEAQRHTYEAMAPEIKDAMSNPHTLRLPDVVMRRTWVVQQAIKTNQALLDRGNGAEKQIARELREARFSDEQINTLLASLRPKLNWEHARALHELDRTVLTDYYEILKLLRQEAGKFSSASSLDKFRFKNREAGAEFSALIADIDGAGARQKTLATEHVASVDVGQ